MSPQSDQPAPAGSSSQDAPDQTGPLGSGEHVVAEGECINSIANDYGHYWKTIWDDGGNAELKDKRKNPDLLLPGDKLVIPPLDLTPQDGATEKRHRFRRKGVPIELVIVVMEESKDDRTFEIDVQTIKPWQYNDAPKKNDPAPKPKPEANQPYKLVLDGKAYEGKTDGDGVLKQKIMPDVQGGKLTIRPGTAGERIIEIQLGQMDPVTEPSGAAKRLNNLGYYCPISNEFTEELTYALMRFQNDHGVKPTGDLDAATQSALLDAHGC